MDICDQVFIFGRNKYNINIIRATLITENNFNFKSRLKTNFDTSCINFLTDSKNEEISGAPAFND